MKSFAIFSTLALSIAPLVAGHGYVPKIQVDGKSYNGPNPGSKSSMDSVIRQVTNVNPSYGADNKNLNCGPGSQPAKSSAAANPGSTVTWTWHEWTDGRKWPHNTGAIATYMANCGDVDCSKFDSSNAKWFKIDESGKENGQWAQEALYQGKAVTSKIPETLAPGNYLIMHQLISLHLAASQKDGAEFYASCAQLKVGGNQKGAPSADELVSMPGAYTSKDTYVPQLYNSKFKYVVPGPTISKLAATSSTTPSDPVDEPTDEPTDEPSASSTPSESAEAPAPTKSSSGGSCRKHKEASTAGNETAHYKPRHISRVMRAVAHDLTAPLH